MIALLLKIGTLYVLWRIFRAYVVRSPLDNIPGPPSRSWKGVFPDIFNPDAWDFHRKMAETYGSVIRIKGLLGENLLYVFDPKAMHQILVKDQDIYEETASFIAGNRLIFGHGLLSTTGEQHRKQRRMLNPVFSIAHMRQMVPIFYHVTYKLRDALLNRVTNGPVEMDLLLWMNRTALELVGQSGLGYSFDSLEEDAATHRYSTSAKQLVPLLLKHQFPRTYLLPILVKIGSAQFRRRVLNMLPIKTLHKLRDIIDTMHGTSVEILESKKKALEEGDEAVAHQVGQGKDILSILLRANMEAAEDEKLSDEAVLAQISTLIFAAMDTTSGALSRLFHLLATNPDVQSKLRAEIVESRKRFDGDLPYDQLVALPYLDAVVRETLRLYGPVSVVMRATREDVVLPLSSPITGINGEQIPEIFIPQNTKVIVGMRASNTNAELWGSDSFEWKPERWLKPLPKGVVDAHLPGIYSNLMSFLGGGRSCIGFKFAQLEMKVVLSVLLETMQFSPSDKKIFWQMNGIAAPTVDHVTNLNNQLPLIVERLKK